MTPRDARPAPAAAAAAAAAAEDACPSRPRELAVGAVNAAAGEGQMI